MEKKGRGGELCRELYHAHVGVKRCKWLVEKFLIYLIISCNGKCSQPRGGYWRRVSTEHSISTAAVGQLGDGEIQRGKLFHAIVTYGCIPKQVRCDGAESQRSDDEDAMV